MGEEAFSLASLHFKFCYSDSIWIRLRDSISETAGTLLTASVLNYKPSKNVNTTFLETFLKLKHWDFSPEPSQSHMDPSPGATICIMICLCWVTATSSFLLYSQPRSLMLLSHYFLSLYFYLCPGTLPLSILSTRWSPSLLQKCPKYSYCLLLIFPQQQTSSSYRAQIPMDFSSLLLCVFLALWKGIHWKQLTSNPHYARCTHL